MLDAKSETSAIANFFGGVFPHLRVFRNRTTLCPATPHVWFVDCECSAGCALASGARFADHTGHWTQFLMPRDSRMPHFTHITHPPCKVFPIPSQTAGLVPLRTSEYWVITQSHIHLQFHFLLVAHNRKRGVSSTVSSSGCIPIFIITHLCDDWNEHPVKSRVVPHALLVKTTK